MNGDFTYDDNVMSYGLKTAGGLMLCSLLLAMGAQVVFCKWRGKMRGAVERFVRDFL